MKKYVACRIVDTAPSPIADRECPSSYGILEKVHRAVPQRVISPEEADVAPLPVFNAVQSLIDRAYGVRSGKPTRVGRSLNIAV